MGVVMIPTGGMLPGVDHLGGNGLLRPLATTSDPALLGQHLLEHLKAFKNPVKLFGRQGAVKDQTELEIFQTVRLAKMGRRGGK